MIEQLNLSEGPLALLTPVFGLLASTLVLMVAVIALRALSWRFIRRNVKAAELRRKWLVQSRNGLVLLFLLGLVIIWGEELRTLALSIVAIAVAFVVATKELILCITGSIVKTASSSFDIGDRIQIKDYRGDVIDHNLLATTLLEVGPGKITQQRTGRLAIIPNALFVSDAVINETPTRRYMFHVISVPFKRDHDWRTAQDILLAAAQAQCKPYMEDARRYLLGFSHQRGLDAPSLEARVLLQLPSADEIHLVARLPVPTARQSAIEQAIRKEVMSRDYTRKSVEAVS